MARGGGGWGAGKIILAIVGGLILLTVVCCGGVWFLTPAEVKQNFGQGISFATSSVAFATSAQNRLGKGYVGALQPDDEDGSMVAVIAVPASDELTPERIRELQDIGWELYVNAFSSGGMGVKRLAIGTVKAGGVGGAFVGWRKNQVSVEELVERTGLAAPPDSPLLETIRKSQEEQLRKQEEERQKELTPEEE